MEVGEGEGKRREGGSLGRKSDGAGYCSEGQILGYLRGQRYVKNWTVGLRRSENMIYLS